MIKESINKRLWHSACVVCIISPILVIVLACVAFMNPFILYRITSRIKGLVSGESRIEKLEPFVWEGKDVFFYRGPKTNVSHVTEFNRMNSRLHIAEGLCEVEIGPVLRDPYPELLSSFLNALNTDSCFYKVYTIKCNGIEYYVIEGFFKGRMDVVPMKAYMETERIDFHGDLYFLLLKPIGGTSGD